MGNGYLYYQPERDAGIQTVDFGEGLEYPQPQSEPVSGEIRAGLGGQVFPSSQGRFDRVRLSRNGISDLDLEAALETFEGYAEARGLFAASLDHAKTFGGYCTRIRLRGTTTIPLETGNAFAALSASGTVASGDYVIIESGYPEFHREKAKVSSYSANTITLSAGLKRSYLTTPILVRWCHFWPFLVAENRGAMITSESGVLFNFAAEARTVASANRAGFLLSKLLDSGTGGAGTKPGGKASIGDLYGSQVRDDGLGKRGSTSGVGSLLGTVRK